MTAAHHERSAYINVVGHLWMPATLGATCYRLSSYDVENIKGYAEHLTGDAQITREAIDYWLALNSGDFQSVEDFHAVIGAFETPWQSEENECTYWDCMCPPDGDE